MASFRSEAEAFSGMSGMAEGHDRYARGLKPRALDRGVGSFHLCHPLPRKEERMAKRVKNKRGPKPKYLDISCPNSQCKQFGKKGLGNVVSNGTYRTRSTGKTRLFLCRTCGKAFSSRTGTTFFDLRSPKKKVLMGLKLLAKGLGLRATSRVLEIKLDTLRRWLAMAALHCEQVSDMLLQELKLSQVQVDEVWTLVKKTPRSPWANDLKGPPLAPKGRGRSLGSTWAWGAFTPEFRLRLVSLVGNRNLYSARRLFQKIQRRLDESLPLFTSDSLQHYTEVLLELFGYWEKPKPTGMPDRPAKPRRLPFSDLRYAQVHKASPGKPGG